MVNLLWRKVVRAIGLCMQQQNFLFRFKKILRIYGLNVKYNLHLDLKYIKYV